MKKDVRSRKEIAEDLVLEQGLDYILETHETPDYVEVIGSMGGDAIRFRVYDDGNIYEK